MEALFQGYEEGGPENELQVLLLDYQEYDPDFGNKILALFKKVTTHEMIAIFEEYMKLEDFDEFVQTNPRTIREIVDVITSNGYLTNTGLHYYLLEYLEEYENYESNINQFVTEWGKSSIIKAIEDYPMLVKENKKLTQEIIYHKQAYRIMQKRHREPKSIRERIQPIIKNVREEAYDSGIDWSRVSSKRGGKKYYTVSKLKEFLESFDIKTSGKNKQELVDDLLAQR